MGHFQEGKITGVRKFILTSIIQPYLLQHFMLMKQNTQAVLQTERGWAELNNSKTWQNCSATDLSIQLVPPNTTCPFCFVISSAAEHLPTSSWIYSPPEHQPIGLESVRRSSCVLQHLLSLFAACPFVSFPCCPPQISVHSFSQSNL